MSQYVETPTKTFVAGGAIPQFARVKLTSGKLALAGASDQEIGTLETETFADGDWGTVRLRTAAGTAKMIAAGAVTAGPCYAAANGRVDDTGTVQIGDALEAATAAGDIIEVLRGVVVAITEA